MRDATAKGDRLGHLAVLVFVAAALCCAAVGCGESDDNGSTANTPTVAPGATNTPTASPTPTESGEPQHEEIHFGSTASGGGALAVGEFESGYQVPKSDCLGGTGPDCLGGTIVYIGISPGLDPVEEDTPSASLFRLADDTTISLEVLALEAGLSFRYGDVLVSTGGESVVLGTTPDFHADFEWQITAPASAPVHGYGARLRLTTTSPAYQPSEEFIVSFFPTGLTSE